MSAVTKRLLASISPDALTAFTGSSGWLPETPCEAAPSREFSLPRSPPPAPETSASSRSPQEPRDEPGDRP